MKFKFEEFPQNPLISIRIKPDLSQQKLKESPISGISLENLDKLQLFSKDNVFSAKPLSKGELHRLRNHLSLGHHYLAQLQNPAKDGSIELQILFFFGPPIEIKELNVLLDEYTIESVKKLYPSIPEKKLPQFLEDKFNYSFNNEDFFLLYTGTDIEEIESENQNKIENKSFNIIGNKLRFVAKETGSLGEEFYQISKFTRLKRPPDKLRYVRGKVKFTDQKKKLTELVKAQINQLFETEGSYLKKWDDFANLEGEFLLKKAREFGYLEYSKVSQHRDGTASLHLTKINEYARELLNSSEIKEIELTEELPEYLVDRELKFTDFLDKISKNNSRQDSYFEVVSYNPTSNTLKIKGENIPKGRKVILSLLGDTVQIKRRIKARQAIIEGRSANPQLAVILEEKGQLFPPRRLPEIKPLSYFVKEKIFKKEPTAKQIEAIKVALNTPDIALIQGPPGTGKTTVIAAIIERLNEIYDKRENLKGTVLLTAFQHDAVENMLDRISVNGLPVPKFGKRSGTGEDELTLFEKKLESWISDLIERILKSNPQISQVKREKELKALSEEYSRNPTRGLAIALLEKIVAIGSSVVGEELYSQAEILLKKFRREKKLNSEKNPFLERVRSLRVMPDSFGDDGPDRAFELLETIGDELEREDRELLEKAAHWEDSIPPPSFLGKLKRLKKKLLIEYSAPPIFRVDKHNEDVLNLTERAIERVRNSGISAKDAVSNALAEFVNELRNNPYEAVRAVSEYSFAFASTAQQSVAKELRTHKGIKDSEKISYEYVIVDEAARISPLDLMIPMSQGKRIILVGDHRQLPHLIDQEIARQMERGVTEDSELDWLKKSMFQYLFSERLKALEERDGIPRRVTLDVQYRMHPLLGEFVSRNFYERFDPNERFSSGREASEFSHNLPGTDNKPAVWLSVPYYLGNQERRGTSWTRPVEAKIIADKLREWIESSEGKSLTFGVITFYKAQADLIKEELKALIEKVDSKRLRIGTVDAFQGMEFDVVFLSAVRVRHPAQKTELIPDNQKEEERQARRLFGHLGLYNRLNVSMSRQKRLLVVVGDPGLVQNQLAEKYIPGLVDFYNLCLEKGKILNIRA